MMITEGQIRTAIAVLQAFADGECEIDDELAVELLDAAAGALSAPGVTYITCEINDDPTTTPNA